MADKIYRDLVSTCTCPQRAALERETLFRCGPIIIGPGCLLHSTPIYSGARDDIVFGCNEPALQHHREALEPALASAV